MHVLARGKREMTRPSRRGNSVREGTGGELAGGLWGVQRAESGGQAGCETTVSFVAGAQAMDGLVKPA